MRRVIGPQVNGGGGDMKTLNPKPGPLRFQGKDCVDCSDTMISQKLLNCGACAGQKEDVVSPCRLTLLKLPAAQQAVKIKAPAVAASALGRYAELGLTPTGVQVPGPATLRFGSPD